MSPIGHHPAYGTPLLNLPDQMKEIERRRDEDEEERKRTCLSFDCKTEIEKKGEKLI